MNQGIRVSELYVRNWKLLVFSYFVPVLMFLPFAIAAGHGREGSLFLVLLGMVTFVCSTAFYLAAVQMEFLSRAFTFLLPGIRRGMLRQHILATAALSLVVVVLVLTLPGFAGLGGSRVGLAWSTAGIMATIYGLILLLVFHFPYSSWLPFQATWMVFVAIKLWVKTPPETLAALLDHPAIWTASVLLTGWLVRDRLSRPALHRRLVEQPHISLVDLTNQAKIEQFKQACNRHKNQLDSGQRPGSALIRQVREMAARNNAAGRHTRALVNEALAASLLTSIPRRQFWVGFLLLTLPAMIVALGYMDGKIEAKASQDSLVGWFPGFAFMYLYLNNQIFFYLKTRPLGLLRGRRDMHRAGWLTIGLIVLLNAVGSGLIWLLFLVGHTWLPQVNMGGWVVYFNMPSPYTPLVPLFTLPAQLMIFILWRMKGTFMVLQQSGMMLFFLFHGLLLFGNGDVRWMAVGLATACWLALPFVWRWRVWRTDLA